MPNRVGNARILVVDDEPEIRDAISDFLFSKGLSGDKADAAESALELLGERDYALVITDMKLPGMDGIELSRRIKGLRPETDIIVITAYGNIPSALQALGLGADDYILKPFNLKALEHSILKVFEKRRLERENSLYQLELEARVELRSHEIKEAGGRIARTFFKTLHIFGNAMESREVYLHGRAERITLFAIYTARLLGWGEARLARIILGTPISDIGKLALPEELLLKKDPLSDEEREQIRSHVAWGIRIISNLDKFMVASDIIQFHHERLDGSGYPEGQKGDRIPGEAHLVGICDSYDAMTHSRPWRDARTPDQGAAELEAAAGRLFEREMTEAFLRMLEERARSIPPGSKPTKLFYSETLPILTSPHAGIIPT